MRNNGYKGINNGVRGYMTKEEAVKAFASKANTEATQVAEALSEIKVMEKNSYVNA